MYVCLCNIHFIKILCTKSSKIYLSNYLICILFNTAVMFM